MASQALIIDEIIRPIFTHIDSNEDLYALLCTCRAFVRPARDKLWVCLPDLKPVMRLLPDEMLDFDVDDNGQVKFVRPPLL